jgi:hypothetical protein
MIIGKGLKGGFHGLIEVLSWHFLGESEGNLEKPHSGQLMSLLRFESSTS